MKKARVVAVCTVGLVLALLLGGASVDQSQAVGATVLASTNSPSESLGVVLDLAGARTWTINGKSFLFVPVPHTDLPWQPQAMSPMEPAKRLTIPEGLVRRSLWFMPIGQRILWGALFDNEGPLLRLQMEV